MRLSEDIRIFLPKFLASESTKELLNCLNDFPNNIDNRLYTSYLQNTNLIYQGDGINNMLVVNIPDPKIEPTRSIILSNTCDIDLSNERFFNSNILYSPIFNMKKYRENIIRQSMKSEQSLNDHIESIKKQEITQIFYLPELKGHLEESIVFFDRVCKCPNNLIDRSKLNSNRIFTLSDYGAYLFILKLSIHFTRIQDKIERKHGGFQ